MTAHDSGSPPAGTPAGPSPGGPAVETARERWLRLREERRRGPTTFLDPAPPIEQDTLWRGLSRGGEVRLLVARTTRAVGEAVRRQECPEDTGRALAAWATATLLLRSTLDPDAQLQAMVRDASARSLLVVDVFPGDEGLRASVPPREAGSAGPTLARPGDDGLLEIARSRARGEPYRSLIQLHPGGVEDTMMSHLLDSAQILSLLRLSIEMDGTAVRAATGFLLQVTPEGTREDLARLVANLETLAALPGAMTRDDPDGRGWAGELMRGLPWDQCARETVRWSCRCSHARVLSLLASLPAADVQELARADHPHEVVCEFCRDRHLIAPHELAGLLAPAS